MNLECSYDFYVKGSYYSTWYHQHIIDFYCVMYWHFDQCSRCLEDIRLADIETHVGYVYMH